jgi:hypothetical protein
MSTLTPSWRLLVLVVLLLAGGSSAQRARVPAGVRYVAAAPEVNEKAKAALVKLFSGSPPSLDIEPAQGVIMLGPFLGQRLAGLDMSAFLSVTANIPFGETMATMKSYGARTPDEARALMALLRDFAPVSPVKIRSMAPQEMKLIWPFIAWDITEPVFVVESGQRKWVVSLEPSTATPTWVEDLSSPCFTAEELDGRCLCATVQPAGNDWKLAYVEKKACAETARTSARPTGAMRAELLSVRLLQPEEVVGPRITAEGLAAYAKRLVAAVSDALPAKGAPAAVTLSVAVKEDGHRLWVTPSKAAPLPPLELKSIAEAARRVTRPGATGLVVFQLHLQLQGGAKLEEEAFEDTPEEWRAAVSGQKAMTVEAVVLKAWK